MYGKAIRLRRSASIFTQWIAVLIVLLPFGLAFDVVHAAAGFIPIEQLLLVELILAFCLVFWNQNGDDKHREPSWPDFWLGVFSLAVGGWVLVRYDAMFDGFSASEAEPFVLSIIFICIIVECCRRTAGTTLAIVVATFFAFGYLGQYLPGRLGTPATSLPEYASYVVFYGDAVLGKAVEIVVTIVVVFVLFGKVLSFTSAIDFIRDFAIRMCRGAGGPIKVSIFASGLLGSIIGSTTSNILTSGSFSIPLMRKMGIKAKDAAAIEAVASSGGQLTPPIMGLAAFLMIELAGLSYTAIIKSALIPSFLFYFSLYILADRFAEKNRLELPAESRPVSGLKLTVQSIPLLLTIALLVSGLYLYSYAPERAAALAVVAAALYGLGTHGLSMASLGRLLSHVVSAGRAGASLLAMAAGVGIMIGATNSSGLGVAFVILVSDVISHGLFPALAIAAVAAYLLGIGMATLPVYAITGTLIAPSLIELGLAPITAHLFVFYAAMLSMITPPVAIACLVSSNLAGASFFQTSLAAIRFGWLKFFLPFMFVYAPELLLIGDFPTVAGRTFVVIVAIIAFTVSSVGYDGRRVSARERILHGVVAALLLFPILQLAIAVALAAIYCLVRYGPRSAARMFRPKA